MNKCQICGAELKRGDQNAICITVCSSINHSTNISNLSYCNECFKRIVYQPLKELDNKARLNIVFDGIEVADDDDR